MSTATPSERGLLTSKEVDRLIASRRTIHAFRPESPPRDTVLRAVELACRAPNHRVTEPWHFYLIGKQTRDAIAALNARLVTEVRGSVAGEAKRRRWQSVPGWLAVTCDIAEDPIIDRENYAACCCAIQNLSLYLWSNGIGSKWTTGEVTRHPKFYDLIWVDPEVEILVGLIWYGYPAEVPNTVRKGLDQVLIELP